MMTTSRQWQVQGLAMALGAALGGCGEPPPMVKMAPPGQSADVLAVDTESEAGQSQALGESAGAQSRREGQGEVASQPNIVREPTEPGEEVVLDELGLSYQTLEAGDPDAPRAEVGDTITVKYTGRLQDATVFDETEGDESFTTVLRPGSLIRGWVEGIPGMRVGEVRRLTIPPDLAYGANGTPDGKIPPNAALTFEVELVDVKKAADAQ